MFEEAVTIAMVRVLAIINSTGKVKEMNNIEIREFEEILFFFCVEFEAFVLVTRYLIANTMPKKRSQAIIVRVRVEAIRDSTET